MFLKETPSKAFLVIAGFWARERAACIACLHSSRRRDDRDRLEFQDSLNPLEPLLYTILPQRGLPFFLGDLSRQRVAPRNAGFGFPLLLTPGGSLTIWRPSFHQQKVRHHKSVPVAGNTAYSGSSSRERVSADPVVESYTPERSIYTEHQQFQVLFMYEITFRSPDLMTLGQRKSKTTRQKSPLKDLRSRPFPTVLGLASLFEKAVQYDQRPLRYCDSPTNRV